MAKQRMVTTETVEATSAAEDRETLMRTAITLGEQTLRARLQEAGESAALEIPESILAYRKTMAAILAALNLIPADDLPEQFAPDYLSDRVAAEVHSIVENAEARATMRRRQALDHWTSAVRVERDKARRMAQYQQRQEANRG